MSGFQNRYILIVFEKLRLFLSVGIGVFKSNLYKMTLCLLTVSTPLCFGGVHGPAHSVKIQNSGAVPFLILESKPAKDSYLQKQSEIPSCDFSGARHSFKFDFSKDLVLSALNQAQNRSYQINEKARYRQNSLTPSDSVFFRVISVEDLETISKAVADMKYVDPDYPIPFPTPPPVFTPWSVTNGVDDLDIMKGVKGVNLMSFGVMLVGYDEGDGLRRGVDPDYPIPFPTPPPVFTPWSVTNGVVVLVGHGEEVDGLRRGVDPDYPIPFPTPPPVFTPWSVTNDVDDLGIMKDVKGVNSMSFGVMLIEHDEGDGLRRGADPDYSIPFPTPPPVFTPWSVTGGASDSDIMKDVKGINLMPSANLYMLPAHDSSQCVIEQAGAHWKAMEVTGYLNFVN